MHSSRCLRSEGCVNKLEKTKVWLLNCFFSQFLSCCPWLVWVFKFAQSEICCGKSWEIHTVAFVQTHRQKCRLSRCIAVEKKLENILNCSNDFQSLIWAYFNKRCFKDSLAKIPKKRCWAPDVLQEHHTIRKSPIQATSPTAVSKTKKCFLLQCLSNKLICFLPGRRTARCRAQRIGRRKVLCKAPFSANSQRPLAAGAVCHCLNGRSKANYLSKQIRSKLHF